MYFSSEGHTSIGGYDNYMSELSDSTWKTPVNIGYPVNSTDDDKFLQPVNNGRNAYYSFTTDYKKKEIFYLDFGDINFDIKGKVSLADTTLIFDDNYTVYLVSKSGDTLKIVHPEAYSGSYDFKVKPGEFSLIYEGAGYFTNKIDTAISRDFPLAEMFIDVSLLRDSSVARPRPEIEYEKINLQEIPTIAEIDTAMLDQGCQC